MTRWMILAALGSSVAVGPAGAQESTRMGPESPTAKVAVLPTVMYNEQANVREASDTAKAAIASAGLHATLSQALGPQLVDSAVIDTALASKARSDAGSQCNAVVKCARSVARELGARWVVLSKVSKTSNLIWLLTGQLVRVETGEVILDDSTELKGEPGEMVRRGIRIFGERVARTVRHGGYTTNFPTP